MLVTWKKSCDKPRQHIKKLRHHFARTKIHIVQAMHFPVVMNTCESWTVKKAEHQRTDAFKLWCWRRLWRVSGSMEIKPIDLKGNQPWLFIGRTDAEAKAPILWPFDGKSWLTGKKSWCWERLRAGERADWVWDGRMASLTQCTWAWANCRRYWRQGSLVCWSPWVCKELHTAEWLSNSNKILD